MYFLKCWPQVLMAGCCFFSINPASGQNLVKNPGFESYTYCPSYFNSTPPGVTHHWYSPDTGTPDYFNSCSRHNAGVPYNWAGISDAKSGNAYVGIYAYKPGYREYIQTRLTASLQADKEYMIRFYYKQASNSAYLTGDIGVFITGKTVDSLKVPIDTTLHHRDSISYDLADQWRLFEHKYQASGGEDVITIGNYAPNAEVKKTKVEFRYVEEQMLNNSSYFYIDDVSVMTIEHYKEQQKIDSLMATIAFGKPITLKNVLFEFNSAELKHHHLPQLDSLAGLMSTYPLKIKLRGFTDSIGSEDYNKKLSYDRAVSVGKYLVANGVDASLIKPVGYGEHNPVSPNTKGTDHILNRRVEFELYPLTR